MGVAATLPELSEWTFKATKSGEQVVIFNVYKYFKVHNHSESENFLFKCTSEATGSSILTVRIVKQSDGPKIEKRNSVNWMNLI